MGMAKKGARVSCLSVPSILSGRLPHSPHPLQASPAASSWPHIIFPITCAPAHQTIHVHTHACTHACTHADTCTHVPEHELCKQKAGTLGGVGSGRGGKDHEQKGMDVRTGVRCQPKSQANTLPFPWALGVGWGRGEEGSESECRSVLLDSL